MIPAGTRLVLDPGTRRPRPGVVTGGTPWRVLRLAPAADRLLDAWSVGTPVGGRPAEGRLAARLVDAGLAHPRPGPPGAAPPVTVVVPVRDRAAGLVATLAALDPRDDVVVVDDGSTDAGAVQAAVAARPRTRLARRAVPGGPAAARNTGWRSVPTAPVVAFLDADCVPDPHWAQELARWFADPAVVAVAARVRPLPAGGGRRGRAGAGAARVAYAAYESVRSPLDLGPRPAPVRPGSRVAYLPAAALLVRRSALDALGGFDEALRTGEDVDLVWRLGALGRVRYEPAVTVGHPVRPGVPAWLAQRFGYGRSAGPLAERHGAAVAPVALAPGVASAWALLVAGRPLAAAGVAVAAALTAAGPRPGALREVLGPALGAEALAGPAIAAAVRRPWWPVAAAVALRHRRARRWLALAAAAPPLAAWWRHRPPGVGPGAWLALWLADDAAYGAGVWAGVLGCRTPSALRALAPSRPGRVARRR